MKQIYRTYKFRIYPNKEQQAVLARYFGSVRFVYNHFLAERKQQYEETQHSDDYYKQAKSLTELKKQEEYSWLKEINSQTLQHALRHLETAYVNFFRGTAKFPNFKSKKSKNSFSVPQNCSLSSGRIYIPKFKEGIKVKEHRKVKGLVKQMTISLTPTGKYYVSILTEELYEAIQKTNKSVGIDLGLKDFVITSEGKKYKNHRYIKQYEKELAMAQKHLSRKQHGSNSYEKQRRKVAKIYEKISSCRLDMQHKVSLDLVRKYDIICLEDLNIKGMVKNHRLAKAINDASWGQFVSMLTYKAELNDKQVIKIDRWYPSSKTCHNCGWVNEGLKLSDRQWVCPHCGEIIDRDINAAKNILSEGIRKISVGHTDYTDGDGVRLGNERLSMKSERSPRF